jgi:hypothetical protein
LGVRLLKVKPALAFAALAMATPVPARADDLCRAIAAFARAPLSRNAEGAEVPRSVEFLWRGVWMDLSNMGYSCRYHGDPAGRDLCRILGPSAPQEFRTNLIFRILTCYGYRFPASVGHHWHEWRAQIDLGDSLASSLRLDISMYQANENRDAIRLVVLPANFDPRDNTLPGIDEPVPAPGDDGD